MSSSTEPLDIPFYEVLGGEGELRTQNQPGQIQRETITDRGAKTKFRVQATLHAYVHGTLDSTSEPKVPASIIVLEYQLKSLEADSSFENVYTELKFREVTNANQENPSKSRPNVKKLEPFRDTDRWNVTSAEISDTIYGEGKIGGSAGPVTLEATVGKEHGNDHKQKYYIEGDAGKHFDAKTQTNNKAWWNIKQNQSQKDGIPRNFRVAVLLERSGDADFEAKFTLDVKAGFRYTASKVWTWCTGRAEIDDPIVFRPSKSSQDVKGIDDPSNLGEVDLAALCPVWGRDKETK